MKNIIYVLLFIAFVSGCRNKNINVINDSFDTIDTIEIEKLNVMSIAIDSIINHSKIIELEGDSKEVIGGGSEVLYVDTSHIFIQDKWGNKRIMVFSFDGGFNNYVGQLGKGPNEYVSLNDAIMVSDTINLLVSSGGNDCIFKYDISGAFLSKIRLELPPVYSFSFDNNTNNYIFYLGNNKDIGGRLCLYNLGDDKYTSFLESYKYQMPDGGKLFFKNQNEEIFFWEVLGKSVYTIEEDDLKKVCYLDWGEDEELLCLSEDEFTKKMNSEKVFLIKNVLIQKPYELYNIVEMNPGQEPALLYILKYDDQLLAFNIEKSSSINISNIQYMDNKGMLYFLIEPNDSNYKENVHLKSLSGYIFCLQIDINDIISKVVVK